MDTKVRFAATVGELREVQKSLPDETLVAQARDEEGNDFLLLISVETGLYSPEADLVVSLDCAFFLPLKPHSVVCLHDWQHAQAAAEARQTSTSKSN